MPAGGCGLDRCIELLDQSGAYRVLRRFTTVDQDCDGSADLVGRRGRDYWDLPEPASAI